ncbi:head completion/stabilization protein [Stutzerimonas stutzeri]|uniref:Head completion/stabilization protein n=1 Tax=Stutzerimonas stutzeri TaxID=316 RepID=A0A6I6LYN8_STUST|nr:head completion/stabilization protein [Stutzerimonas stutzeri]QGZ31501.1 head completion/stabilization protein [Stutzerimonas stutzeri]
MSAFIATGGSQAPHPITNDGWFPPLDGQHMREALRLDGSITDARLETAAVNAVIEVNRELKRFKFANLAADHESLADVPADQIQNESELLHLYRRAIYCSAGAELAERYRDYSATGDGAERAEALTPTADEYRRDARWAIRSILGRVHTTVELI